MKNRTLVHQYWFCNPMVWFSLLWQNKGVRLVEIPRAVVVTLLALLSWPFQLINSYLVNATLKGLPPVQDPVFIIGHWRSGTTFLHYLMAVDDQFGYLSYYHAFIPNLAVVGGRFLRRILSPLMPKKRPQDNIELNMTLPTEEENPLSTNALESASHSFFFPNNEEYFLKYAIFRGTGPKEKSRWARAYTRMIRRISVSFPQRLLLIKNPHNTGRIKELLEIFPNARFIHIYRNPYDVFPSTRLMYDRVVKTQFLQSFSSGQIDDKIIAYYQQVMGRFFESRSHLPQKTIIDVRFEDFEKEPLKWIERIYNSLDLRLSNDARAKMLTYLDQIKDYKKNVHRLDPKLKQRLNEEWAFGFETLGYIRDTRNLTL